MSATTVDTSYRSMSVETLQALRLSFLTQLKAVEGVGQSHSASGRSTSLADFGKVKDGLRDVEAALEWKANPANAGNNGYTRRFASFTNSCNYPDGY